MSKHVNSKLWRNIAITAGIFAFIISILLIANYLQTNRIDPVNTEIINALVDRLSENPGDEQLREQIREMDLLARKAYFTNQWQIRTGGLLLIFSVGLVILAMQVIKMNEKIEPVIDEEKKNGSIYDQFTARKWIAWSGAAMVIIALVLAFISHTRLESKFQEAAITAASDTTEFVETVPVVQGDLIATETETEDKIEAESLTEVPEQETEIVVESEAKAVNEKKQNPIEKKPRVKGKFPSLAEIRKNYPSFRGPNGLGIAYQKNIPTDWDGNAGKNILWKTEIPLKGYNSPIIWDDKAFLSGANATKREVYCFDMNSGSILWTAPVDNIEGSPAKSPDVTDDTGHAAPTMTTNGTHVYAIFSNGDVIALDMNGTRVWARNLGVPKNHYGHSSSLYMYEDLLIVQYDHKGSAQIMALDAYSGDEIWNTKRKVKVTWASPILVEYNNRTEIVLVADPLVASYDAETGQELWALNCMFGEVGPSAAYSNGIVYALNEYASLVAIKLGEKAEIIWEDYEYLSDVPSPVAIDDLLFIVTSYGIVLCYNAQTGTKHWEHEFPNGFYASPVLVDDKIYMLDNKGIMHIVKPDKTFELINSSPLGTGAVSTPAFANGKILIRTNESLYCIGKN